MELYRSKQRVDDSLSKENFSWKNERFFFLITVNTTFVRFILEFERGFKFLFSTWIDQQNGII